jgi:hypothetical protein
VKAAGTSNSPSEVAAAFDFERVRKLIAASEHQRAF